MKSLRWLGIVPLLGIDGCPEERTYWAVEFNGALDDQECGPGGSAGPTFVNDYLPLNVPFVCGVGADQPVHVLEPAVRCHPSGELGLRISPTCTLAGDGGVKVDVEVELLGYGCDKDVVETLDPTMSVELAVDEESGWTATNGGQHDDWNGGQCGIFGPPTDTTGGLVSIEVYRIGAGGG